MRACLALVVLVGGGVARADFFSSTPGPLAQAHANLDDKGHCQDCHEGARALSVDKCLACHKPIGARQRERRGLHASAKALGKPCELCHTNHKGRGRDILGFVAFGGKERFDHGALTGFLLDGKHAGVRCERCHTQKTASGTATFLRAATTCIGCHQSPHGELQPALRRCERCHDARSWRQVARPEFDHGRDARYPLERKHDGVSCAACHARQGAPPRAGAPLPPPVAGGLMRLTFRWGGWSIDCQPCHDNVHGDSLFGRKACRLCHTAKVDWTRTAFDHNRRTRFALDGAHASGQKAPCAACHPKAERAKPDRACVTCHPNVHKERFARAGGVACASCHTTTRWSELRFDHTARTRFSLTGLHARAACRACHRGAGPADWERFDSVVAAGGRGKSGDVACMSCHKHENVHQRQYGNERCLECHKMAGAVETKRGAVADVHGPGTRFPLSEGHAGVECARCHPNNVFTKTPLQCGPACHPDQLHKGTLGDNCLRCHSGGSFMAREFDHDKQTRWPLVGNHKDVLCDACHPRRDFAANRGLGAACVNCHKKDDVHAGALGTRCERCHDPTGKSRFDHNDADQSDWPLRGAHKKVRCADCHITVAFRPTPRECGRCHPEPDVHRGQLGTACERCHGEDGWARIRTGHDRPTPPIGGAHAGVACRACHLGGRILAGLGNLCVDCHQRDDVHHNALGPHCGECHTQRSFAAATFQHARVGCDLVGVHRVLPCVSCHLGGNFMALAPDCAACHRKDAIRGGAAFAAQSGGSPATHAGFPTCANCHNPNFFGPAAQGSAAFGRESVCR